METTEALLKLSAELWARYSFEISGSFGAMLASYSLVRVGPGRAFGLAFCSD